MRDLQVLRHRRPRARHFGDALRGRGRHRGKIAETRQQRLRQRLGVLAGDAAEQHEFQKLVIGERAVASVLEALAQARAMIVIVRLLGRRLHFRRALDDERRGLIDFKREQFAVADHRRRRGLALGFR
jgi:hypothetical protein